MGNGGGREHDRSRLRATGRAEHGAALDTQAKYDITFWPRNMTDKTSFEAMAPVMKAQFPNLTVTFDIPTGTLLDKLNVALAADTPPDGIVLGLGEIKHMVNQKAVLSLQDYLKRDKQAGQPQGLRAGHGTDLHLRQPALRHPRD